MAVSISSVEATAATIDGKSVAIKTPEGIIMVPTSEVMRMVTLLLTAASQAETQAGATNRKAMPLADIGLAEADQGRVVVSLLLDRQTPPLQLIATSTELGQWADRIRLWLRDHSPKPSSRN